MKLLRLRQYVETLALQEEPQTEKQILQSRNMRASQANSRLFSVSLTRFCVARFEDVHLSLPRSNKCPDYLVKMALNLRGLPN